MPPSPVLLASTATLLSALPAWQQYFISNRRQTPPWRRSQYQQSLFSTVGPKSPDLLRASPNNDEAMPFRTVLDVPPHSSRIQHSEHLLFLGSCFTENIGGRFKSNKWPTCINPFGIQYNPVSIAQCIRRICSGQLYTADDLGYSPQTGLYYSFDHHSCFSRPDAEEGLSAINESLLHASKAASSAQWAFLTLGTAYAYTYNLNGRIVANCHKLPSKDFTKTLLTVPQITEALEQTIRDLRQLNPAMRVVLTLSPVRHIKDGIVENSRCKAQLLCAAHQVVDSHSPWVTYFPAYEIVLDDLRDYRFYESDMLHPSGVAVDYIDRAFTNAYVDPQARAIVTELQALKRALSHRPFHPEGEPHQAFLRSQMEKVRALEAKHPHLDMRQERDKIASMLTTSTKK